MFQFRFAFVFVLLYGSEAVNLPDIGKCTFMEYFCDALKCNTDFIKKLQKDPRGDCSAKYRHMVECVINTVKICVGDKLSDRTIESIIKSSYQENSMCFDGALEIPTVPPNTGGSICTNSFSSDANNCLRSFHQKFAANKSDPSLCTEQAKAKKCLKGVISSECNFPASSQKLLDLGYSDYNPFCASNRDPGATGNGICYGVKDLNNPLNNGNPVNNSNARNNGNPQNNVKPVIKGKSLENVAASGLKKGVWHTGFLPFLLLMFFVKA